MNKTPLQLGDLYRSKEVIHILKISRSTFYKWNKLPSFPSPANVQNINYYSMEAIGDWLQSQANQVSDQPQNNGGNQ